MRNENSQKPYIFFSYASEDRDRVNIVKQKLQKAGFALWIDKECLIGGQVFGTIIEKAFQQAAVIIVFLSHHSVNKAGFFQKELSWAEQKLLDMPEGRIAVIPVLLDKTVKIPAFLEKLQYIERRDKNFPDKLIKAVACALAGTLKPHFSANTPPKMRRPSEHTPYMSASLRKFIIDEYLSAHLIQRNPLKN